MFPVVGYFNAFSIFTNAFSMHGSSSIRKIVKSVMSDDTDMHRYQAWLHAKIRSTIIAAP